MPDIGSLTIAGINFNVASRNPITLEDRSAMHQLFLGQPETGTGRIDVAVRIELNNMPDTRRLEKIFETPETWSIFRYGNGYALSFPPYWLALASRDFTDVTVHCGTELIRNDNGATVVESPLNYPLDQVLTMHVLGRRQGLLLHAACARLDGHGMIFAGRSGAGKSTLAKQFSGQGNAELLSDDRTVVRKVGDCLRAFGTPWHGQVVRSLNESVELAAVFLISQAPSNRIRKVEKAEALERLLPVASIPWYDPDVMPLALQFCEYLVSHTPVYELAFTPSPEVVDLLRDFASSTTVGEREGLR